MSVQSPAALAPAQPAPTLRLVPERDPVVALTPREREVLSLMASGHANGAICGELFIAPKTLERHVQNIFLKLDLPPDACCHRRVSAVLAWLRSPVSRTRPGQVLPAAVADRAGCALGGRPNAEEQLLWTQHA